MPTNLGRERHDCPVCGLSLMILRTGEGATIEYDVADWARLCRYPRSDSPLVCPPLQPLVKGWLGRR